MVLSFTSISVFEKIESNVGWKEFNRMCEDAPDISTKEKQKKYMKEKVGAELYEGLFTLEDSDHILTNFICSELKVYIHRLYTRLRNHGLLEMSADNFTIFIKEMFFCDHTPSLV